MTRPPRQRGWFFVAAIAGLHLAGFAILLALVVPARYSLAGGGVFGVGVGLTAYTLGLRHALDADHIGAIDNATRKLLEEGQRPLGVGFFFALGHSTIVFALGAVVAVGVRGLGGALEDEGSALQTATGLVGPLVSGLFLCLIGLVNLAILRNVVAIFRRTRRGELDEAELERQLRNRGAMSRLYGRASRAIRRPWQMYPLGCLFGLGFDTASEVALLVLAGGAAAGGLPFYAIVCLPILFAAGMTLLDTLDGALMTRAYDWASEQPLRRVFYNVVVTALSVALALAIGSLELAGVAAERLGLEGGVWDAVAGVDLNLLGYAIAALFALTWMAAVAAWRFGRLRA
jgi:high-affinity nickel-transport protein